MGSWLRRLIGWSVVGALGGATGGAVLYGQRLVRAGVPLDGIPLSTLAFEVMELHVLAAYGAAAGVGIALLLGVGMVVVRWSRSAGKMPPASEDLADPDARIRSVRARRAERYLAGREERTLDDAMVTPPDRESGPEVESIITARNGQFTYRILAFRALTHEERMEVVREALERGHLEEPEPGGTATLVTSIGR